MKTNNSWRLTSQESDENQGLQPFTSFLLPLEYFEHKMHIHSFIFLLFSVFFHKLCFFRKRKLCAIHFDIIYVFMYNYTNHTFINSSVKFSHKLRVKFMKISWSFLSRVLRSGNWLFRLYSLADNANTAEGN